MPLLRLPIVRLAAPYRLNSTSSLPDASKSGLVLASLSRISFGGRPFIPSLKLRAGESWLVAGPAGSGKTILAALLSGQIGDWANGVRWASKPDEGGDHGAVFVHPALSTHLLDFREDSSAFSYAGHYFQERFESLSLDGDNLQRRGGKGELDLLGFLLSGLRSDSFDPDTLSYEQIRESKEAALALDMMDRVGLPRSKSNLLFMKLSNGQSRRARIGRLLLQLQADAVSNKPSLLLLDEPYVGLDRWSRSRIESLFGALLAEHRKTHPDLAVALFTRDPYTPSLDSTVSAIPSWATHMATLSSPPSLTWTGTPSQHTRSSSSAESLTRTAIPHSEPSEPYISLRNIKIAYPKTPAPIMQNVTWHVPPASKWALLGPNGSGKSTLLAFLTADHPQAYSNDVMLFGKKRGAWSIWDLKKRIGFTSPELLLYLPGLGKGTLGDALRTAWTRDPFEPPATESENAEIDREIDTFARPFISANLLPDLETRWARVSTSQQRLTLFLRALLASPKLIVLDEPWQGMSPETITYSLAFLDHWSGLSNAAGVPNELFGRGRKTTLIVTTHDWERELPRCVDRLAWLKMVEEEGVERCDGIVVEGIERD